MITALDSSVIIDVLVGDPIFGQKSLEALKQYYRFREIDTLRYSWGRSCTRITPAS